VKISIELSIFVISTISEVDAFNAMFPLSFKKTSDMEFKGKSKFESSANPYNLLLVTTM
jgi:hypothetical protein